MSKYVADPDYLPENNPYLADPDYVPSGKESLTTDLYEGSDDPLPVKKPKRMKRNLTERQLANLRPFDSERAKAISASANAAKSARAEMRRRLLATVCKEGIEKYLVKAIKEGNQELMTCCEKALKLVGLDYSSSEESVQKVQVKADVDSKSKVDTTLHVTIEEATK